MAVRILPGRGFALTIRSMARNRQHDPSRRYHDRVARQYDSIYDDPYWAFHDELTWRSVKPHLPRDVTAECADLGCGTGKWGLKLLKSGFATTLVDHRAEEHTSELQSQSNVVCRLLLEKKK